MDANPTKEHATELTEENIKLFQTNLQDTVKLLNVFLQMSGAKSKQE